MNKFKRSAFCCFFGWSIGILYNILFISLNKSILHISLLIILSLTICAATLLLLYLIYYLSERYKWNNGICRKCTTPWVKYGPIYVCPCSNFKPMFHWKIPTINIAEDFTETPGARFKVEGLYSGQEFRERFLEPLFEQKVKRIKINFDNLYGCPPSFLDGSFGMLADKYGSKKVLDVCIFISNEDPDLIPEIISHIKERK